MLPLKFFFSTKFYNNIDKHINNISKYLLTEFFTIHTRSLKKNDKFEPHIFSRVQWKIFPKIAMNIIENVACAVPHPEVVSAPPAPPAGAAVVVSSLITLRKTAASIKKNTNMFQLAIVKSLLKTSAYRYNFIFIYVLPWRQVTCYYFFNSCLKYLDHYVMKTFTDVLDGRTIFEFCPGMDRISPALLKWGFDLPASPLCKGQCGIRLFACEIY